MDLLLPSGTTPCYLVVMDQIQRVVRKRRVEVWDPSGANRMRGYKAPPRNTTFKALLAFGVSLFIVASVMDGMNPEVQAAPVKKDLTDPRGGECPEKQVAFVTLDGAPIPEPSTSLLLMVSSLALLRRRRSGSLYSGKSGF